MGEKRNCGKCCFRIDSLCHRYPPTMVSLGIHPVNKNPWFDVRHPLVDEKDFCGEYKWKGLENK